ncbi:partial two-component system, OmpR family, sensor histidine kinase BaeS, partial [Patescibacteria group bacterium]
MLMVVAMVVSTHWLFRQGFTEYLHQVEASRLDSLVSQLELAYQDQDNWDFLRNNPQQWREFLDGSMRRNTSVNELPPHEEFEPELPPPPPFGFAPPPKPPRPLPPDALFLGKRLRLLDVNRGHVAGSHFEGQPITRALQVNNQIVGWLELRPNDVMTDELAKTFVEQQKKSRYILASLAFVLSMFAALFLARQLLSPIRRIAGGVKSLSAGNYQTRIETKSRDELGQLAQHFNLLAQTLQNNETSRRQWIADISHELRTPLSVLRGELEALQDGVRQPTPNRIHSLHSEVLGLTKLVEDLYQLSLSDAGALNYHKEALNVTDIVIEVQKNFSARFDSHHKVLREIENPNITLPVFADKRRLMQLFNNLAENSFRYTNEGGFCEITLYRTKRTAMITFQDSPPSVPHEALSKLFERLYRVEKSRSRELGGAGL